MISCCKWPSEKSHFHSARTATESLLWYQAFGLVVGVRHSNEDYNQGIWLTYGICKSRETVGMPFLQASQDSVDSNTATWNEQIYILVPQNTLANPLDDEKFDTALQQLPAGWSGQCQNSSRTDRWHTWGGGRLAMPMVLITQTKWLRNRMLTES